MRKISIFLLSILMLALTSCSSVDDIDPIRIYKAEGVTKGLVDNHCLQDEPEYQLWHNLDELEEYFSTNCYERGMWIDEATDDISHDVDFSKSNLFGYMNEEGTSSIYHCVELDGNTITIYSYTPDEISTCCLTYKWIIFAIPKQYDKLSQLTVKTERMSDEQASHLLEDYNNDYYF